MGVPAPGKKYLESLSEYTRGKQSDCNHSHAKHSSVVGFIGHSKKSIAGTNLALRAVLNARVIPAINFLRRKI